MASLPATVLGVGAVLWVVVTIGLAPFALAERIRALLERGPTGMSVVNYVLATFVLAIGHVTAMVAVAVAFGPVRDVELLRWLVIVNVGYPAIAFTGGATVLVRWGKWGATGRGIDGRLVLGAAAAWYALVTTIAAGVALVVVALFSLPGGY